MFQYSQWSVKTFHFCCYKINQSKTVRIFTALSKALDLLNQKRKQMDFGEEIPLLDDTPLNPLDAPKFYEAFKEFDQQDTGFISITVNIVFDN